MKTPFFSKTTSLGLVLAWLASSTPLLAQLMVNLELERDSYVLQEPTLATVTVENRAGKDIVLGGPNGGTWLSMDVREMRTGQPEGLILSARNGEEPKPSTVLLKAGASTKRKIDLQAYYLMNSGQHTVNCAVYFAELDRWVGPEKHTQMLITAPRKPFFQQTVGVKDDTPGGSGYRRYKIFASPSSFNSNGQIVSKNLLYVQIADEVSQNTLTIYPLGEMMKYYKPDPTVDAGNNLHVLYQTGPKIWSHATINSSGEIKDFTQHETVEASRPELVKTQTGGILVRGGRVYDPKVEAMQAKARNQSQRSLSERPPGLPEEKPKS